MTTAVVAWLALGLSALRLFADLAAWLGRRRRRFSSDLATLARVLRDEAASDLERRSVNWRDEEHASHMRRLEDFAGSGVPRPLPDLLRRLAAAVAQARDTQPGPRAYDLGLEFPPEWEAEDEAYRRAVAEVEHAGQAVLARVRRLERFSL